MNYFYSISVMKLFSFSALFSPFKFLLLQLLFSLNYVISAGSDSGTSGLCGESLQNLLLKTLIFNNSVPYL